MYVKKEDVIELFNKFSSVSTNPDHVNFLLGIDRLKSYKGIKKISVEELPCPQDCVYLVINQEEQDRWMKADIVTQHLCNKYMVALDHGDYFPQLERVKGCNEL